MLLYIFIFFFKQKTAYEMRISDWSSDVCSSDLPAKKPCATSRRATKSTQWFWASTPTRNASRWVSNSWKATPSTTSWPPTIRAPWFLASSNRRSEEHTSELQSLMRNSYAVFCLKKQNITPTDINKQNSIHETTIKRKI